MYNFFRVFVHDPRVCIFSLSLSFANTVYVVEREIRLKPYKNSLCNIKKDSRLTKKKIPHARSPCNENNAGFLQVIIPG